MKHGNDAVYIVSKNSQGTWSHINGTTPKPGQISFKLNKGSFPLEKGFVSVFLSCNLYLCE